MWRSFDNWNMLYRLYDAFEDWIQLLKISAEYNITVIHVILVSNSNRTIELNDGFQRTSYNLISKLLDLLQFWYEKYVP